MEMESGIHMNRVHRIRNGLLTFALLCLCLRMLPVKALAEDTGEERDSMVENILVAGGYFARDFAPDVLEYDVFLISYPYKSIVSVDLTDPRFAYHITGEDRITNNSSGNLVTVTVSDPLGQLETVEYRLTVFVGMDDREPVPWQGLSYLDVENGIFSPQFNRYRTEYYAIVENEVDSFAAAGVNFRLVDPDAVAEVECRGKLQADGTIPEGKRVQYAIRVTETDGSVKTYYLNLYRKAAAAAAIHDEAKLSNITINGGVVALEGFSPHQASYEVRVPRNVTQLDIQAYPAVRSHIVKVLGPRVMRTDGPVFVNLLVTSTVDPDVYSIYTLRLEYDSFLHTQRYTAFQLAASLLLVGAGCLWAGFLWGKGGRKGYQGRWQRE